MDKKRERSEWLRRVIDMLLGLMGMIKPNPFGGSTGSTGERL
jgi:hypothetical protein